MLVYKRCDLLILLDKCSIDCCMAYLEIFKPTFFNCNSLHTRLNSHCEAWRYKKKKYKNIRHTGNSFKKNMQIKGVR